MGGRGSSSGSVSKLPKLEGSEKQIKWANEIRDNVVKMLREESKIFEKNKKNFKDGYTDYSQDYKDYKIYSKEALKVTKSSKWIESFKNIKYSSDEYIKRLKLRKYDNGADREDLKGDMYRAMSAYKIFVQE